MSTLIRFWVPGKPVPGGSKRGIIHKTTGKVVMIDMGVGNRGWKQLVAVFAFQAMAGQPPLDGPLKLTMIFCMPRPKSHFHTGKKVGILRPSAPHFHTSKPDATKLVRSTEDACKGILWPDDSAISRQEIQKIYEGGNGPGVTIEVQQLES